MEANTQMNRQTLSSEDGWVMMTAVICLGLMLTVVLASFSLVDTSQSNSRKQRERETSLNVAEGALYAQGFTLAQGWPGHVGALTNIPATCTQTSTDALCPTPAMLTATGSSITTQSFTNIDAKSGTTWSTRVRDNGGPLAAAYVPADADATQTGTSILSGLSYTCSAPCRWDANGDKQLWVQARAVVRGRPRSVVALMKLERVLEATPETAVTAGGINIGNNGQKIMVYAPGSQVVVRCNIQAAGCVLSSPGQIYPAPISNNAPPLMTSAQLARFRQRAITDGKFYAGCPPNDVSGNVVWVEACALGTLDRSLVTYPCNPAAPPRPYGGGTGLPQQCVNQATSPGILIWHCGRMSLSGGTTFAGIIYAVNNSDGTCPASLPQAGSPNCTGNVNNPDNVVSMTGGFGIWGVLAIDGPGCLFAGSDGVQVQFDPNVFSTVASYGTVGLVQNTWRELPAS
jgi:Tfp pilus assembly protein PilX